MAPLILLAEDDDPTRAVLREVLQHQGWRVVELEDGFELQDYLLLSKGGGITEPDAVVTDLNMPGTDGLEAVKKFGRRDKVVLISGNADEQTVARANEAGVKVVLRKPLQLPALVAELERVLGTKDLA